MKELTSCCTSGFKPFQLFHGDDTKRLLSDVDFADHKLTLSWKMERVERFQYLDQQFTG